MLASILATRLNSVIGNYIHSDQFGFIPGHLGDNIRRVMNIIKQAKTNNDPLALLFADAEKAFDQVD